MKKVLLAIFRAVIVLPFTAGTRGGRSGPFRLYDCSTSSVVMLSSLLAVIVVFTGSLAISKDLLSRLMAIIGILIIIVIAGIISCLVISYTLYRHGMLSVTSTGQPPRIKSKNLQLLFLWLFVTLASIHSSLSIIVEIECLDSLSTIKITQNGLLVVFMIGETALISVLTSFKFSPLPLIRYAMRLLIAVNLSMWFNAIIRENTGVHPKLNSNSSDIIPVYINCVRNSTSGKVFTKSWRFLSPAFVEFSLLAVTLLAEIISVNFPNNISNDHKRNKTEINKSVNEGRRDPEEQEIHDEKGEEEEEEESFEKVNEREEDLGEETPLLHARIQTDSTQNLQHTSQLYSSVDIEERIHSDVNFVDDDSLLVYYRVTSGNSCSFYLMIGLSVFLCLPNFVGYLLKATVLMQNEMLTLLLGWYEALIKLCMTLAVLVGFYFTENVMSPPAVSRKEPSKTKDWIFLVSVFSMFISHCFEMLAGYISEDITANAMFVCNCLSFVQDYLQTVFLLHAMKCQRNVSYAKCTGFVSLCLFMTITNFGCWAIDGFIIAHSLQQTRMETLKILSPTVWMTLSSFFLPLTLYYRFASAFAFHELYSSFIPK